MLCICKKELHQFFSSLTGYLAIVLFLLVNGLFIFVLKDSNIFDFGYASLDRFFELAPWVLIILVPAITMRSISEEIKTGTIEVLRTRPLSCRQIVGGKYLSILVVLLFAILPTLLYVFTIQQLSASGDIDTGGITGSYIGLFMLGAVFAAISLCCSGYTANAVVAFLISAFVCLLLYTGFNAISKLPFFRGGSGYFVEMLGIDFHYQSMSRGLLDTRDAVYFLSIIMVALFITEKKLIQR
jgi:ABC-2 type transport system permease protein